MHTDGFYSALHVLNRTLSVFLSRLWHQLVFCFVFFFWATFKWELGRHDPTQAPQFPDDAIIQVSLAGSSSLFWLETQTTGSLSLWPKFISAHTHTHPTITVKPMQILFSFQLSPTPQKNPETLKNPECKELNERRRSSSRTGWESKRLASNGAELLVADVHSRPR